MRARPIPLPSMIAAAFAGAMLLAAPAMAQEMKQPVRTITIQGEGSVTAKPDTASVNAGVVTEAETAREALTANTDKMSKVFSAIKSAGIAEDDIRTSNFSVSPVYSHSPRKPDGSQEEPKITGYRAFNNVSVIIRDLTKVGAVLDELVTAGANNVNGVNFYIDDTQALTDKARTQAVEDALRRATLLTQAASANLGKVITISENGGYTPQPVMMMRAEAADFGGKAAPVAGGTQEITANVTLVIELE